MSTKDSVDPIPAPNASTVVATKTVYVTVPLITQPTLLTTPTTPLPTFLHTGIPPSTNLPNTTVTTTPITNQVSYLVHTGSIAHPNHEQITTIWVAAVMLFCILIGWNMVIIRSLLHPWKMLTNLIHEASHVFSEL
jgi:hypothetical protein